MKKLKKFLCLALVLCLMVPVALMLSACGPTTIEVSTFDELKQALEGKNDIVKLTSDIDVTATLKVTRKVTLDMNGKTLSNSQAIWSIADKNDWSIISVRENGNLIINGNGKISTLNEDCYALDVMDGGNLTIEDGEFVGNVSAVYAFDGHVDIKGGKYSIQQLNDNKVEGPYGLTINIYNNNPDKNGVRLLEEKATIAITGGEFNKFDPTDKTDNKVDDLVPQGYKAVLKEGTTDVYVVVAE